MVLCRMCKRVGGLLFQMMYTPNLKPVQVIYCHRDQHNPGSLLMESGNLLGIEEEACLHCLWVFPLVIIPLQTIRFFHLLLRINSCCYRIQHQFTSSAGNNPADRHKSAPETMKKKRKMMKTLLQTILALMLLTACAVKRSTVAVST